MGSSLLNLSAVVVLLAIPRDVILSYAVGGTVFAIGLAAIFLFGDWQKAKGFDKLILFGPVFYAAPLAAFGTEHFTQTAGMLEMVPAWIPWHEFWIYFVGGCFIAAGFSLVTKIQSRLAASLLAMTFFCFVVLMDIPGWAQDPGNRFAPTLALRELSFSGGALALAATLSDPWRNRGAQMAATIARYFIGVPVLFYSFEQFLHADHVPGIPLEMVTPTQIPGHALWTYLVAAVYAIAGILLVAGWKTRAAAAWIGLSVLVVEVLVYIPIAVINRASLIGMNYLFDTLMYCGAVLLLAGAMPKEAEERESRAVVSARA